MGYPHKILTCCYCGTRAALVLRGRTRHELSCSSCGAPLHDLKMLPRKRTGPRAVAYRPDPAPTPPSKRRKVSARRPGRRKGLLKKAFEEAFDILDEIFD